MGDDVRRSAPASPGALNLDTMREVATGYLSGSITRPTLCLVSPDESKRIRAGANCSQCGNPHVAAIMLPPREAPAKPGTQNELRKDGLKK